jgi:hypothetical protein
MQTERPSQHIPQEIQVINLVPEQVIPVMQNQPLDKVEKNDLTFLSTPFSLSGRSVVIDITRKTTMSRQEATIQAVQTLYARLETLRQMKVSDMLSPGQQTTFEQTLEEAYAALAKIETELDELGETLVYHHARLGGAFE